MGYYSDLSIEILGDKTRVAILRFLYRNKPNRFSQKQISNSVGIHPSSISRTCNSLERLNLIDRFSAGKTILYKLDEDSYVTKKLLVPLFENEKNFFTDLIKSILQSLEQNLKNLIKGIFLFGSIIKREDTPSSDIDVAIVIKPAQGALLRTETFKGEKIEKIKNHFLNAAVMLKLNLDIHFFIEGEKKLPTARGLSLKNIQEQGELIWENNNEKLSKE